MTKSALAAKIASASGEVEEDVRVALRAEYARVRRAGILNQESLRQVVLSDGRPRTVAAACVLLGALKDQRAVGKLIRAMEVSRERLVVWEAAKALLELRPRDCSVALIRALEHGKGVENCSAAAWLLGMMREKQAMSALLRALSSSDEVKLRAYAAEALGMLRDARCQRGLLDALEDGSAEVRFWSAYALGRIGNAAVLPRLRRLARADHAEVTGLGTVSAEAKQAMRWIRSRERQGHAVCL